MNLKNIVEFLLKQRRIDMEEFQILTPGQKIKEIRNRLGLKQSDIVGGEITRNLISIIENDKANLTPNVAEIIVTNINKICKSKGISFTLDIEYLLENVDTQINIITDKFISYLTGMKDIDRAELISKIKQIDNFFLLYRLPEKESIIYSKLGQIFGNRKEYIKSYAYYLKALENSNISFNSYDTMKLFSDIAYICIRLNRFSEALEYINTVLQHSSNITDRLYFLLHFNAALAYKKQSLFDSALDAILNIEKSKVELNLEDQFDLYTMKANCMKEKKFYKAALELHNKLFLLVDKDDLEKRLIVLCNMLEVYSVLNDKKNIIKLIATCNDMLGSYDELKISTYTCQIYFEIGSACYKIGDLEESLKCYDKALYSARLFKNKSIISSTLDNMLAIYVNQNNLMEVDNLRNLVLEFLDTGLLGNEDLVIYKLIKIYNEIGDKEGIDSLIGFILNAQK
jgi:HTH-type transcriptional regulator, quorum sensing regulator NprR